ncbi:NADH-cytochrome b5 reductase [Orobanche gracilis]
MCQFSEAMDFWASSEGQLFIGVSVGLIAVGAAYFLFSSKKPKACISMADLAYGLWLLLIHLTGLLPIMQSRTLMCLDPESFKEFKLVKKTQLSHNVAKFKFALPTPTLVLGLPIGQHISCRGKDGQGEDVVKPYTPTTLDSDVGYFELVIKMYPQGRMSHHFREMREGDYLPVKGPKYTKKMWYTVIVVYRKLFGMPNFRYINGMKYMPQRYSVHKPVLGHNEIFGLGRFKYQPGQVRAFGMIAGGSGITPMFQVARAILENPDDQTKVYLIYANVTFDDILLKDELDNLAKNYPDRFKLFYVLNQPPEAWEGGVGFVSREMIQAHCPAPAADIQILRCGPPPMNKAMAGHLEALEYSSEMQFQF